jgi:type I restriction enzyme S subunit
MGRGRKSFSSSITDNWEKAFYKSIGFYITLINNGLSRTFKNEPLKKHIKIIGGFAFKNAEYKKSGIPIIRISDFNNEKITLDSVVYYDESKELEKYVLNESDIIIALTGGTIGKLGIVQPGLGKLYLNQRVGKFEVLNPKEFEKEYIYWIARGVEGIVKNLAWGAAIPNVSPKQIEELLFPIPSKEIQNKIILFLNDLRDDTLIEDKVYFDFEIENEIKSVQNKLVKVFEINNELSIQLNQLENLNKVILQEAVQGKLVKQDSKDEPASELLKRIKVEKAKSDKKDKSLLPIKPDEIPFDIPKNWVWCRLGDIIDFLSGNNFESSDFSKGNGVKCIKITNAGVGEIIETADVLPLSFKDKYKQYLVYEGDLVLALTRPFISTGLKISICPFSYNNSLLNQRVSVIRPLKGICKDFVFQFLSSNIVLSIYKSMFKGQGQQPNLKKEDVTNLLFPLPPENEQIRVVSEIKKQLTKTKNLKEHILANQQATEQLLKALLHQAFQVEAN